MTIIICPKCQEEIVSFNDTYVKLHEKEENWLMANCT